MVTEIILVMRYVLSKRGPAQYFLLLKRLPLNRRAWVWTKKKKEKKRSVGLLILLHLPREAHLAFKFAGAPVALV